MITQMSWRKLARAGAVLLESAIMNFPKFWAKASNDALTCWRWSNASLHEAQQLAEEAVRQLADRVRVSGWPTQRYGYSDRPLREPVLREFTNADGSLAAAVTRNAYGCHVLNTARALFVDIDLPEPKPSGGLLKKLFGKPEPANAPSPEAAALARIESWTRARPGWGWRVYRTRAGLRLLATHDGFDPEAPETDAVFDQLGADPLYRRLCRAQKCFRARLTPKPWRCGLRPPDARWPWVDTKAEARFASWENRYREASRDNATCALVKTLGNAQIHPSLQPLLALHDEVTRVGATLPLA